MAENQRYSDKINNARSEDITLTTTEQVQQAEWAQRGGLGYYTKTSLQNIVDNFIVAHTGTGMVLGNVPRHQVEYWAQRGLQELSYDVLFAEKNIELELNPDTLSVPLPSDYVNYVKVVWIDGAGTERTIHPSRVSNGKFAILQDNEYKQLYDQNGDVLEGSSETLSRFQEPSAGTYVRESNLGNQASDSFFDQYYSDYYGRRYGNDPQFENYNGTFILDTLKGMIYFDSSFAAALNETGSETEAHISLRYISDGLGDLGDNGDLSNAFVHKFAEDALYAFIQGNLANVRVSGVQVSQVYLRQMKYKMNTAKIRLMNMKTEELTQVMRGKSKWIKH